MHKFNKEYEIKATPQVILSFLSTAKGLEKWFAEKAISNNEGEINLIWDGEDHFGKIEVVRNNTQVKIKFRALEKGLSPYIDFKLDYNEMTNTTFLSITDFSIMDDDDELNELWDQLIENLKEIL